MKGPLKKKTKKYYGLGISLLVFVIVFLAFSERIASVSLDYISAIYASLLATLVNNDRSRENLSELRVNPTLVLAAQMKASDMAARGYFSHNTPEGLTPWYWFARAHYNYSYAGENLAVNFVDSADVESAWMASPLHRLNILNRNFTEIGIATSTGVYQGRHAIFIVQMFGRPVAD